MAKQENKGLAFSAWPQLDRERFEALSVAGDIFDSGPWSSYSTITVSNRRYGYGQWMGFLNEHHSEMLLAPPEERITVDLIKEYVAMLRRNCTETAVAIALQRLQLTIRGLAPDHDWDWIYKIERRIARRAVPLPKSRAVSPDLLGVGLDLISEAMKEQLAFGRTLLRHAEKFRDGLMIAVLAEAPMRRAGLAQLCLGEHVVKEGDLWRIYLRADMVKTRVAQDFELSAEVGAHLDRYVSTFRPMFENADGHAGMWPYRDRPMTDKMVRRYTMKHTRERLGEAISPHGFRRAAATFVVMEDPENARMVKDLLGHTTFAMTEKHYLVGANSRSAGRSYARVLAQLSSEGREAKTTLA